MLSLGVKTNLVNKKSGGIMVEIISWLYKLFCQEDLSV